MKPQFCFKYDGKVIDYNSPHSKNGVYEVTKGVYVTLSQKNYDDFDATEWVLFFENKSDKISGIFSDIADCAACFSLEHPKSPNPGFMPKEGDACVITMTGVIKCENYWDNDKKSAEEFAFNFEYLDKCPEQTKTFANIKGLSSNEIMPFFDVTSQGDGYFTAIGWSGSWKAEFKKTDCGINMRAGLSKAEFYLEPGEQVRTASILVMRYQKGEDKHNKIRSLIKKYYSHKSSFPEKADGVMAYEMWGGLPSAEMKKRLGEFSSHGIKFDKFWVDAAWYGNCKKCEEAFSGDWGEHTGEWTPNPKVHPGGLADVVDCAKDAGMDFMLWIEPERAITGTRVVKEHPEWFITLPDNTSNMLWYGNEDALEYTKKLLCDCIEKYSMSCYRQDFNVQLEDYCIENDKGGRIGITEIKHVMGMYKLWDYLLEKYPHLIIDNCCGGGRRIDIETLRRSTPVLRTDYQCNFNPNPEVYQVHNTNISAYFPYTGCGQKVKGDTYAVRSSYSTSWSAMFYSTIFQSMTEEDFSWTKKISEEYMRIRRYFSTDFYNHGSNVLDDTSWTVWQYHDAESQSGIVMAFRRENSPFEEIKINLRGVDNGKKYEVSNLDTEENFEVSDLLRICLSEKRSSVILEYRVK